MAPGVVRRELSVSVEVVDAFVTLYRDHSPVAWLDSRGERGSGTSVLATGEEIILEPGRELSSLREHYASRHIATSDIPATVPLGFLGVIAYDGASESMDLAVVSDPGHRATSHGLWVTRSLEFNEHTRAIVAWGLGADEGFEEWVAEVESALGDSQPTAESLLLPATDAVWRDSPERYLDMISRAQGAIRDGEVYQICLTTSVEMNSPVADWELHRVLRDTSPTHHQALFRFSDYSLVSASPETFLTIDTDGLIQTRPIKGTRPRGAIRESDQQLARELVESDKERAENLMIVDLMRNDLQRVCDTGSVNVAGLFEVETYSSVHQLVSTVEGKLKEGVDGVDALMACFPAGSMTGAPKHRAVALLSEWESAPRGIYSGIWGWWRLDGSMEWAMTIRSALMREGRVSIGVGGGITWSSVPEREIAEVGHKARRLLEALGVSSDQYS